MTINFLPGDPNCYANAVRTVCWDEWRILVGAHTQRVSCALDLTDSIGLLLGKQPHYT